jgi:hypothetical protein
VICEVSTDAEGDGAGVAAFEAVGGAVLAVFVGV